MIVNKLVLRQKQWNWKIWALPSGPGFTLQVLTTLRCTTLRSGLSAAIPNAFHTKE